MSKDHIIAGIDIWSSKIRTVIWIIDEDKKTPHIIWTWVVFSNWIRKWKIVDLKELVDNINASLEEAETVSWIPVQQAFVSISNSQISSFESKWVIAISWNEITEEDIQRALDSTKNTSPLNPWVEIIDIISKNYYIDNWLAIANPVWLSWVRLEADAEIITWTESAIQNITKSINWVWVEIVKMVPATIASSNAVLTKKQKEVWIINIDLWSSSTWISVYEEWVLLYSWWVPVWAENVTNDVAIWIRCSIETAERLKIEFWDLDISNLNSREEIDLSEFSEIDNWKISKKHLNEIIKARYEEIFTMVNHELKVIWKDWMLPWWAIITWWWSKITWIEEVCKEILHLPAQVWFPIEITSVVDKVNDPEYATAIWLIKYWAEFWWDSTWFGLDFWWVFNSVWKFFSNITKSLLPN